MWIGDPRSRSIFSAAILDPKDPFQLKDRGRSWFPILDPFCNDDLTQLEKTETVEHAISQQ